MLRLKIVHHFLHVQQWCICWRRKSYLHCNAYVQFGEYSDNFWDTPGSLWQFKRDGVPANNADLSIDNCQSFKYKAALLGKSKNGVNNTNGSVKEAKIVVPLKYFE